MGFLDRLGETLQDIGWVVAAPAVAAFDLAKIPFDHDEGMGKALTAAGGDYFSRQFQLFTGDDKGTQDPADDEENLVSPAVGKALDGLEWLYDEAIARPIITGQITQQRLLADLKGYEDGASPFDIGSAWDRADADTGGYAGKGTSIGREFAYMWAGIGADGALSNEGQRTLDEHSKVFDVVSGSVDATARFVLDPTIVLGKAAKVLRVSKGLAKMGSTVSHSEWLGKGGGVFASNEERAAKAIDWVVDANPAPNEIVAAFRLNEKVDGYPIANTMVSVRDRLLAEGKSRDEVRDRLDLINRVGMGDVDALKPLASQSSEAADALAALFSKRDDAGAALRAGVIKRNEQGVRLRDAGDWVAHVKSNGGYMSRDRLAAFTAARQDDYLTSSEFVGVARERLKAVKSDVQAAAAEAARLEKLHSMAKFQLAGSLTDDPLVASAIGRTKGLEKRAARERLGAKGYRQQRTTDLAKRFGGGLGERAATAVFQSSALNIAVKAAFPHVALALKASDAFRSPLAKRFLDFNESYAPQTLNSFLRSANVDPELRSSLVTEFASRVDDFERTNTVDRAIHAALEAKVNQAAAKHNVSEDARIALLANLTSDLENDQLRKSFATQQFTAHEDEFGVRGDFVFTGKDPNPVLDTQTLKKAVLPDLHEVDHMIRRTHNYLTDMTAWAVGDRAPDPGRISSIAQDVFDVAVKPRAAERFARRAESVNNGFWRAEEVSKWGLTLATNFWKKSMLARPAYVAKYLTDSEMRNLAVLGPKVFGMRVMPGIVNAGTFGQPGRVKQWLAASADANALTRLDAQLEAAEDAARAALRGRELAHLDEVESLRMSGAMDSDLPSFDRKAVGRELDADLIELRSVRDEIAARLKTAAEGGRKGRKATYGSVGHRRDDEIQTALGPMASAEKDPYKVSRMWEATSRTTATLSGDAEKLTLANLMQDRWQTIKNTDPTHADQWAHAVNAQILQSKIVKQVLANDFDTKKTVAWLKRTPEGRALRDQMPWTAADADRWVQEVEGMVLHYLPSDELLATARRSGHVSKAQLESAIPEAGMRPPVHGEGIGMTTGRGSTAGKQVNEFWNNLFSMMADVPEDILARHPLYRASYEQEVKRRAEHMLANPYKDHYTLDELHELAQKQAHKYAREQVKKYMFDVATTSDLSHGMRFASPFIAAWEDTVRKWGRIAVENPDLPGKAYLAWNAPNDMHLVVDQDGNPVDQDNFNEARFILIQTPSWMGDHKLKIANSQLRLPKQALNLVLQGGLQPGFGPLVAYPVGEFSKENPSVDKLAKFVNPFGPPESVWDAVAPSTLKRIHELTDEQSTRHVADTARMYEQMVAEYRLDPGRYPKPTPAMAEQRANSMGYLKILNNFLNPFPVIFDSPYKMYEDSYRALRSEEQREDHEPGWADQKFIEEYGETFFPLVQSASRNNSGLLANTASKTGADKYRSMISQYGLENGKPNPTMTRLIVGIEGEDPSGEQFNESAYAWQQQTMIAEGSNVAFRDKKNYLEASADADTKLGWYKFRQFMNTIDAEALNQGYETYKDDEELVATRQEFLANLAQELPAWYVEYSQQDPKRFERNIGYLTEIAASPQMQKQIMRTDMRGVEEYLTLRQQFITEMESLDINPASVEADEFRIEFSSQVQSLVSRNTQFAEFAFYPFLERDPLLAEVI